MPKKRKTRKQKENAAVRRAMQKPTILDTITDSHNDNLDSSRPKSQIIVKKASPAPETPEIESYLKRDLYRISFLIILFAIIIGAMLYFEGKYNFLDTIADNLINFLSR